MDVLQVTRDAVCMADDFAGPLETVLALQSDASLRSVLEAVTAARFLQFSSTHESITAVSGGRALATVSSRGAIAYPIDPAASADHWVVAGTLAFRFAVPR